MPREGGEARRLTSMGNIGGKPYFSPDGSMVAFNARLGGHDDVYVIPSAGGIAKRLTYDPSGNSAMGWTPDGRFVLAGNMRTSFNDFTRMSLVRADGSGIPEDARLPSVDEAAYSPDGSHIAYNPFLQWQADSWKRYRGGQTEPVWIVDIKSLDLVKVPRDNSNDRFPVWLGDTVYFLSDRNGPVTLFGYNTKTREVKQLVENHGPGPESAAGAAARRWSTSSSAPFTSSTQPPARNTSSTSPSAATCPNWSRASPRSSQTRSRMWRSRRPVCAPSLRRTGTSLPFRPRRAMCAT